MSISLTSLLVSTFSASLLVIFISILVLNKNIIAYLKPQYLLLCVVLIIIRYFSPYEFFYTITLKSRGVLPLVQKIRELTIPETTITAGQILVFIWIAVAILKLTILFFKQYRIERAIQHFPVSKKMPELYELLCIKK